MRLAHWLGGVIAVGLYLTVIGLASGLAGVSVLMMTVKPLFRLTEPETSAALPTRLVSLALLLLAYLASVAAALVAARVVMTVVRRGLGRMP
jgi:hypothetical protein